MSKKVTVQVLHSESSRESQTLTVPEHIAKQLKIPARQTVVLKFGSLKIPAALSVVSRSEAIMLSSSLAEKTGIPHGTRLRVDYRPEANILRLGPLLGVLMSRVSSASSGKPFGSNTAFCRELTETCNMLGGLVFFFTPSDIGSGSKSIRGWVARREWRRRLFPVPDVIYNRLTTRKLENSQAVQQLFRDSKSRYHTHIFNEKFLDKTDVFQALQNLHALRRYLPESHALRNYAMLKAMVQKYSVVYLKPVRGSLGKGIIRVSRSGDRSGAVHCETMGLNGAKRQSYSSLPKLFKAISGKLKVRRYQIQQGLKLIHVQGRPVDFRALVQKGSDGKWELTSIVARIAGNRHFVSNLARGGTLKPVREALQRSSLPPRLRRSVRIRLKSAALHLAKGLEEQISSHFGELGVDLAVDQKGRVWLLEINSKPSKNDNTSMHAGKARPSVKKIILYTRHLTGF